MSFVILCVSKKMIVFVYTYMHSSICVWVFIIGACPQICVCVCVFWESGSLIDPDGMIDESGCEEMGCRRTDEFVFSACLTEWESEPSFQAHFVLALAPSKTQQSL